MLKPELMSFDAIVVGAGGAGLRAALQLTKERINTVCISKVFPTRSHTVSAQGGITCAIGSADPNDDWRWHMFDTVKGSDYIGDQSAIEYMCSVGPEVVYELEHMGLPFSRTESGRIYQRPFGGQSKDYGKGGQAARTCAAADRTGHALLHTLYQANLKEGTVFLDEWYAIDLVKNDQQQITGVTAICIETGELFYIKAAATIIATGGSGRIFASTTNALINTGDGIAMAIRSGIPVQDMEMWQFHPTGIYGSGVLVTEGCRGEGGYLINASGERFMERYAPNAKDLASRDVVARSMMIEIMEGNGCGGRKDHVELKLNHLSEDILNLRLPGICHLAKTFAHVDPVHTPIPVVPTCHYLMGGIPTNIHGQVISQNEKGEDFLIDGLYACGEAACVSVHGANRLGGNSLLDLIVFGRSVGMQVKKQLLMGNYPEDSTQDMINQAILRLERLEKNKGSVDCFEVRAELQKIMQTYFGVFRDGKFMRQGLEKLNKVGEQLEKVKLADHSKSFNTARIELLELENLYLVARATAVSAENRKESRGAHARNDFKDRDDKNWLKHSLYFHHNQKITYRSVDVTPKLVEGFKPIQRVY